MIHASDDYNQRIQDAAGKIPLDEPVFLLRGQDALAPSILLDWASRLRSLGGDLELVDLVRAQAQKMIQWQNENGCKIPDLTPVAQIKIENEYFPLGAKLTSKENGQLIIALPWTPKEEIVGEVTKDGLKIKK